MTGTSASSAFAASETESPSMDYYAAGSVNPSDSADTSRQSFPTEPFTDEQREQAICRAGIAMAAWYSHWKQSGKPEYLDVAYHFLGLQRQLLAGRTEKGSVGA